MSDLQGMVSEILLEIKERNRLVLGDPQAAVLVPFYSFDDEPHLLLTKRSSKLRKHSGQISFPGGKLDSHETPIIAALRETEEEIGLKSHNIEVKGLLDDFATPYFSIVTPVISIIDPTDAFVNSPIEVEQIIHVPIKELLDPLIHDTEQRLYENKWYTLHHYLWEDSKKQTHDIWGATAGVIHQMFSHSKLV